ncbi:MAG: BACON domain-containing carbohydrate-binding protein [Bacteroidales bacterium]|jgi:Leucine-rich repeat (LRR) protein
MKKILTLLATATAFLILNSCKPEVPFIEASPTSVSFTQEGGTQNISLSTNSMSWTASVSGKGFAVTPAKGSGNTTLQLTAAASTSSSDQSGTLTIKSGTMQATVSLTQSARNTLIIGGTTTSVEAAGGTYTVTLQYNTAYTVEVLATAKSWIQFVGTKALSSGTLEFLVAPNTGTARSGQVTVKDNAGIAQTQTITFNQAEDPRRTALVEIYESLEGDNWDEEKKVNWNSSEPVQNWGGVTMEDGKITGLDLNGFGLNGSLPSAIGTLTDLVTLDLGSNPGLTGVLPGETGDLVNLETFRAVTTGLQGSLPASMGNLEKLTKLYIGNNDIEGKIPESWEGMTAMQDFAFFGTAIQSPLPKTIFTAWTHLGSFVMHSNPGLTGSLPPQLGQMTTDNSTLNIQLHNCNFSGGIPEEWASVPGVCTQLYLYGNQLTEQIPLAIQNHPSWEYWDDYVPDTEIHYLRTQQNGIFLGLEPVPDAQRERLMVLYNQLDGENWTKGDNWNSQEDISTWEGVTVENEAVTGLNLNGFGLNGQLPSEIGDFTSLRTLDLGNNPDLTGSLPENMGNLSELRRFLATETDFTGLLPATMGNLKKLTELRLAGNRISGTIPETWSGMSALVIFEVSGTGIQSPLPDGLFAQWTGITDLLLFDNPGLSGVLPQEIGSITTTGDHLNIHLYNCNFEGGIPESWAGLPEVCTQLFLYNNRLTEAVPTVLIEHPSWDNWNAYKPGTTIHYIRTQQNGVFLDLVGVLPTLSEVTVTELLYNKISVQATVEKQGSDQVTERGFILNTTTRKTGSGPGTFTADFTQNITENTAYTVKAFATNAAGTAYSPEITVTTPLYNQLNVTFTDTGGAPVTGANVYLKRISDQTIPVTGEASVSATYISDNNMVTDGLSKENVIGSVASRMLLLLKPFAEAIQENSGIIKAGTSYSPATRSTPYIQKTNGTDYDYKKYTSANGSISIENIVPGTYAVKVEGYGIVKDFHTLLTVPQGVSVQNVEHVPLLSSTSKTMSLFQPNVEIRPFASPATDDNIMVLVEMNDEYVSGFAGKNLENILICPADTTASIVIIAKDMDQLLEIYETFLSLTDEEGNPNQDMDPTQSINFIENLARRIVLINGAHAGQTNLIPQGTANIKKVFVDQLKNTEYWPLLQTAGITEYYNVQIQAGDGLVINQVIQQQDLHPVLMTDGDGPVQTGGNLVTISSDETVTNISQMGYNGNWHLGVTVK